MAYTATQLITNAWYLSSIVSRDLEEISGDELNDGLNLLNSLLAVKTANQRLIPYFKKYEFFATAGAGEYFIPNLVFAEFLVFFVGSVRFTTNLKTRKQFFDVPRAENITSLPFDAHYERCFKGSNLYLYFAPDQNYPLQLFGKFSLEEVALNEDLSLIYDRYYIEYLRYALAEYMCHEYNFTFSDQAQKKLDEYESILIDISPMDLTVTKSSCLSLSNNFNYGTVNLGRGWDAGRRSRP